MSDEWIPALEDVLRDSGVRVSFSRWCISGLVPDCGCRRCRTKRGEPVTKETERNAEERSQRESVAFRKRVVDSLHGLPPAG